MSNQIPLNIEAAYNIKAHKLLDLSHKKIKIILHAAPETLMTRSKIYRFEVENHLKWNNCWDAVTLGMQTSELRHIRIVSDG